MDCYGGDVGATVFVFCWVGLGIFLFGFIMGRGVNSLILGKV